MSVEAMTMVTISGPEKMVDTAVKRLVVNREFHPESAIKILGGARELVPFDTVNPFADAHAKALEIAKALGIAPEYRAFSEQEVQLGDVSAYLNGLLSEIYALHDERDEKASIVSNNGLIIEQLSHFRSFNVELRDLFTMRYLKFHFGRLPAVTYRDCLKIIDERPDAFFVTSGRDQHWIYGAYFSLPENHGKIDAILASMGFERIHIEVKDSIENTANELLERLVAEKTAAEARMEELDARLAEIRQKEAETLLVRFSWLRYESESFDVLGYMGRRHGKFYLIGWVPERIAEAYADECENYKGFACFLTRPHEMKETTPPVKLKKGLLSDIYQPYLEMYGLPAYGELDPRIFLAITYTILFGIMFGDIGQGLSLVLIGGLLWHFKKVWLGRIVALCGVSATAMGFVYGSVFGNEHLLPWGFKVLEGDNTIKILLVAVVIGAVLIMICMVMNIINGIRMRDIGKIFFEPNGLAGFVFYMGIAVGVLFLFVLEKNIFTLPYILLVLVLPILLICVAHPLTKLIKGEKDWMPKSIGMFFVEGFFEIFETLLSYVSNTVSFLRVGAFAISHAGMMMVVYLLTGDGTNIPGLIFGNIFITGLETMLVCIQVLRLEYYEMFGRFYTGGGIKFSPKTINYSAAE